MRPALRLHGLLFIALLVVLCVREARANEWVDYDDAVRQATRENKFILVNVEERVLSSMWRRGTAFTNANVRDLLASDFVTVFLDLTDDDDVAKAAELGLPDGSLAVLDVDGAILGNWPEIVDGADLADALQGIIDTAGKLPSARDLKKLQDGLNDAREYLDAGKRDRAIKELLDVIDKGFRGEPVREARALLRDLALDARLMMERSRLAQHAGDWGRAYMWLDRAKEGFDGLAEADDANDLLKALRRKDDYKDWKDAAKAQSEAAWTVLDVAVAADDGDAIVAAVLALDAIGDPGNAKDLDRRLDDLDEIEHNDTTVGALARAALAEAEVARLLADAVALADHGDTALAQRAFTQVAAHPNATPQQADQARKALANAGG